MVGIGIIGAGFFGEMHAKAIRDLSDARVVAVSRMNLDALSTFAAQFGCRGYQNYREILRDPEVDVVLIATPHHLHTNIAIETARSNKPMLLEKPMAPTMEECDRILAVVEETGVKMTVGHVIRFARAYRIAKEIIASGEMGEVVLGVSTMSKFWFEPNRRPWHLDRATGGGMWLTAGIHCLDRLTWLVDSRAVSVCAGFGTRFHQQKADDVGLVFIRYANGAIGTVVSTGYRMGAPKHLTELTCTKGTINIEYTAGVTIGRDERWRVVPDSGSPDWMHEALVTEWQEFLKALDQDRVPPVSGRTAYHIMATAFAAEESSKSKCEVAVPLGPWESVGSTELVL